MLFPFFLCAATAALFLSLSRRRSALDTALAGLVLVAGQAWLGVLLTGALGGLTRGNLVLFHNIVFVLAAGAAVWAWHRRTPGRTWDQRLRRLALRIVRNLRRAWQTVRKPAVALPLVLAIGALAYVGWLNLTLPAHDWDGFMYHLFLPAQWLQEQSLSISPAAPELRLDKWVHFPANVECLAAWLLAFTGSDAGVEFAGWPLVLAGALALYALARRLGARRAHAAWAIPVFLSTPILYAQLNSSYVDAAVAGLFFATVYLLWRGLERRAWVVFAAGAIAAGLLCGAKASGPLLAALAAAAAYAGWFVARIGRERWTGLLLRGSVAGVALLAFVVLAGGWFYLRNWQATGNPMYPYRVTVMNKILWEGIDPVEQTTSQAKIDRWSTLKAYYGDSYGNFTYMYYGHPYAGHGPVPIAAGIPAALLVLYAFARRRDWRRGLAFAVLLGAAAAATAALPSLFPRFTLHLDALAALSCALALGSLAIGRGVFTLFLALAVVHNLVVAAPMNFHQRWYLASAARSAVPLAAADSPYSGLAFRWIDRQAGERRIAIAYAGLLMPYPLHGRTLARSVHYVKAENAKDWLAGMETRRVVYLVLGKPGWGYREQAWAAASGVFRLVHANNELDVWLRATPDNLKLHEELSRAHRP